MEIKILLILISIIDSLSNSYCKGFQCQCNRPIISESGHSVEKEKRKRTCMWLACKSIRLGCLERGFIMFLVFLAGLQINILHLLQLAQLSSFFRNWRHASDYFLLSATTPCHLQVSRMVDPWLWHHCVAQHNCHKQNCESDNMEPVFNWNWFSIPIPVFYTHLKYGVFPLT